MAFTYNPSLATTKDWVRFRLGDTDSTWPLLQDEEIDAILTETGNRLVAALLCAKAIVARLSRLADTDNTGLAVKASQRVAQYRDLVKELQAEVGMAGAPVWEKPTDSAGNEASPAFSVGMHDAP